MAIPYGQALHIYKIFSDEEEHNRHLKLLKDTLIEMGYDAQIINSQFRHATVKNRNDLLRRQTQDTTVQYFPGAEKLHHVLRSLQHIIDDDEHFAKIFPTPPPLAFKQPPNFKQTIVHSKLPSLQDNVDHNTIQPCHGNLYKTYQIIDMDTTITRVYGRYSCDSANIVYLICLREECPKACKGRGCPEEDPVKRLIELIITSPLIKGFQKDIVGRQCRINQNTLGLESHVGQTRDAAIATFFMKGDKVDYGKQCPWSLALTKLLES
eukprot:g47400.t1